MSSKDPLHMQTKYIEATADTGSGFATAIGVKIELCRIGNLVFMTMCNNGNAALVNATGGFFKFLAAIPSGWRPASLLTANVARASNTCLITLNNATANGSLGWWYVDYATGDLLVFPMSTTADTPPILRIDDNLDSDFATVAAGINTGQGWWRVAPQ